MAPSKDRPYLKTNEFLRSGEYLVSSNRAFFVIMQSDGNFAVYRGSGPFDNQGHVYSVEAFSPQIPSPPGEYFAIVQDDGNFVLYKGTGPEDSRGAVFAIDRFVPQLPFPEPADYYALIRNDGNFVVNRGQAPGQYSGFVWGSGGHPPFPQPADPPPAEAPTPGQIEAVRVNLAKLIDLNDRTHDYAQDILQAAQQYFSEVGKDPGQQVAELIFSLGFSIMGDLGIPGAGTLGTLFSGLYGLVSQEKSLHLTFANMWERFTKNFLAADRRYAVMADDVPGHWQTVFSDPATGRSVRLASLAGMEVPEPASVKFNNLRDKALEGIRYQTWKFLLPHAYQNWVSSDDPLFLSGKSMAQAREWSKGYVQTNPNYYLTLSEVHEGGGCSQRDGVNAHMLWLATGFGIFQSSPPRELCDKLFRDDGSGAIVREESITTRADVFNNWGLEHRTLMQPHYGPMDQDKAPARSPEMNRFNASARNEKRLEFVEKIVTAAKKDPAVAAGLMRDPRKTILEVTGINVPEEVDLRIFFERPPRYTFVIPSGLDHCAASPDQAPVPDGDIVSVLGRMPRTELEHRILDLAQRDMELFGALLESPIAALKDRFGIIVPEGADFRVIQEGTHQYYIVIPA